MSESLTAFAPVPSATNRHDGWTPERQRLFIRNLARIGVVSAAARAVGMSPKSAYALLRRAGDDSGFAFAWRKALRASRTTVLCAAVDRALNGVETPVFVRGLRRPPAGRSASPDRARSIRRHLHLERGGDGGRMSAARDPGR
jgi:hypothetical protein